MIQIEFKLFAKSRELVNKDTITIEVEEGITLLDCLKELTQVYTMLTSTFLNKCRIAKDNKYILTKLDEVVLNENTTFIIIPPISGG